MLDFCLSANVHAELFPISAQAGDVKFVFDGNGSVVAIGDVIYGIDLKKIIASTVGSEAWISDDSDIFRFNAESKELSAAVLSVPSLNTDSPATIQEDDRSTLYSMRLSENISNFIISPQVYRTFDCKRRLLVCTTCTDAKEVKYRINIAKDLSIFLNEHRAFAGWALENPLENLTNSFDGEKDAQPECADGYAVFGQYFNIISDNQCLLEDDDMESVVRKLKREITPDSIMKIVGKKRRTALESAIEELKNYFTGS